MKDVCSISVCVLVFGWAELQQMWNSQIYDRSRATYQGDKYPAAIPSPICRCSLTWWFDKVKGGVEKHDIRLNLFRQSPFSFLLHVTCFRFIGALFHLLFERYKGDLVFEINGRQVHFTEMDFALITGLKIGDLTVPKNRCTTSTLRDKYFREYPVFKKQLMQVFEELVDTNNHEDVVKVALLLVVEHFLRGTEPKTRCNMDYIYLVDSLDDFYRYPWGSLGYYTMSQGIESAVASSSSSRYTVCGCALPLQVWAVETLPALQDCVVSYVPHQIPRFIQYRGWKGWRYKRIHAIFENKAASVIMKLEPTLREWETDAIRSVRDSFHVTETQEDDEEGNEIDHEEDDESDDIDAKGVEGEGLMGGIPNVVLMEEFRKEREELKMEREELRKVRAEMRMKEALLYDRETLLKREKDLFFVDKEWFFKDKEKLEKEREEFNKEKEGTRTRRGRFVMEECEDLRKRVEVTDTEDKETGHVDLDVQSYSNVKGNVRNESTSHAGAVYQRRAKGTPKPSVYKVSSNLSLSAFGTTPGVDKEKLANEGDMFNKEKEVSLKQRGHFVMEEEGEQLKNRVEVTETEDTELSHASTSHPAYERRTKRIPKPSYYMVSPYLSLSAFDTTPREVREPEQVTAFATSPIPFPVRMDPFRILSAQEVKEAGDWYEANKDMSIGKWFRTVWMKDAWVDSEAIDTYIDFLEKRHNALSVAYPQDCKFCPTYFTQSLEGCLPVFKAYLASNSASERSSLIGQMTTAYAIAKQRDKPYRRAIWCYEQVYAPINHDNSHWFLLVIYPREREIVVVDSSYTYLTPKFKHKMNNITDALPVLFHATGDSTALDGKKWSVRYDESAPKQDNGYDCGIFVMKFIDILCSGLTLKGIDMQKFTSNWRKSIAYDCLSVVRR